MKILPFFLLCFIPLSSYAFESGKYRGETDDGSQYCELDIVQHTKSHTINNLICEDLTLERSIKAEPKEWPFGITKQYFREHKMTMTIEVAANLHKMNYSNKKQTNSYDEELSSVDGKKIHYKFSITEEGNFSQWFDMDLEFIAP